MLDRALLALALAVGTRGPGAGFSQAALLAKMFQYAKQHKVESLLRLRVRVDESRDSLLRLGYALALCIAEPAASHNLDMYVQAFPEDSDGMDGLYEKIELKGLTPTFLYSLELLSTAARGGNTKAMAKVLGGIGRSDGAVAEQLCDTVAGLLQTQLGPTIGVLGLMPESDRVKAYECLKTGDIDEAGLVSLESGLRSLDVSGNDARVVEELATRVAEERTQAQ
jgi:hypothetical protein